MVNSETGLILLGWEEVARDEGDKKSTVFTIMASRCGVIQLRIRRHKTYQKGEEFSLSKFAVRESLENEPNDVILVEIQLYNSEPAFPL